MNHGKTHCDRYTTGLITGCFSSFLPIWLHTHIHVVPALINAYFAAVKPRKFRKKLGTNLLQSSRFGVLEIRSYSQIVRENSSTDKKNNQFLKIT